MFERMCNLDRMACLSWLLTILEDDGMMPLPSLLGKKIVSVKVEVLLKTEGLCWPVTLMVGSVEAMDIIAGLFESGSAQENVFVMARGLDLELVLGAGGVECSGTGAL